MQGASAMATGTHVAHKQPRVARVRVVVACGRRVDGAVLEVGTAAGRAQQGWAFRGLVARTEEGA